MISDIFICSLGPLRTFSNADSGSISCPLFLKQEQVASANSRGQVKIWDLRSSEEVPTKTCHLAMDLVGITRYVLR